MVWLPRDVLRAWFKAGWAAHFGDVEFSMWHYQYVARQVPIAVGCPAGAPELHRIQGLGG
jgi:hypothetical protein